MQALLLVDLQNDFCPAGALAVADGDQVIPVANRLMGMFPWVVATQDWHPPGHSSFTAQGGPWPDHCVQGTRGAEFHPDLKPIDYVFPKGMLHNADSYSGFADDNGNDTGLDSWLRKQGIDHLVIMGLATDYCVKFTVLHALERGYKVSVVVDGCRGVNLQPNDSDQALMEMEKAGATLVPSSLFFPRHPASLDIAPQD